MKSVKQFRQLATFAALSIVALSATNAQAQTIAPTFAGSYSLFTLGTPSGVPGSLGGLTLKAGDLSKLLIGGSANTSSGKIYEVPVIRNGSNNITGFSGAGTIFATAPKIDGGLVYGPNGVLFATTYSDNKLLQFKPGSTVPDKIIDLSGLGISSSTGSIQFTPGGTAVIASYNANTYYSVTLTADGSGTYNITVGPSVSGIPSGPEGIVYVPLGSSIFSTLNPTANWMLVSEYGSGRVSAYEADSNWLPMGVTRLDFVTGLTGAEGALLDPLTNDFMFSTFGGGDQVISVRGFAAPTLTPEAPSLIQFLPGLLPLGLIAMKRKRSKASA